MLNRFDISDEALAYTAARYSRPKWAAGTISRDDAAFIFDMLIREHPRSVAEIGVASGTSTAFLSTVLSDRLRDSRLYSFDQLECLYDVPSKPVGAYLYDLFGELPENLTLGAGIASTKIRGWPGRPQQFDFVFLDASHIHPWPCIDLLAIIDIVNPGSWVVLHDVWLPLLSCDTREYGPMYLYQNWPGEKCAPVGNNANIGAVRLFENPADSAAALIDCCRIPWQKHLPFSVWTGCLQALSQVDIDGREFSTCHPGKATCGQAPTSAQLRGSHTGHKSMVALRRGFNFGQNDPSCEPPRRPCNVHYDSGPQTQRMQWNRFSIHCPIRRCVISNYFDIGFETIRHSA